MPKVDRLITVNLSSTFLAKWTKLQLPLDCLCFKCTVLLLRAHLPENPTLCWDTKRPGSSYHLSSACIIICNTSKKSLKVLEKIKTRGRHAWAGEGWKFGSSGRTFPPADEVWDAPDWFLSIKSLFYLEMIDVLPTLAGRGKGDLALWASASDSTAIKTWIIRGQMCINSCFFTSV